MSTVCLNIEVVCPLTLINYVYIRQVYIEYKKKAVKMLYILINSFLNISMIFYFPDEIYIRK